MQFCSYLRIGVTLNINNSAVGSTGMAAKIIRGGTVCGLNGVGKKIGRAYVLISSALWGVWSLRCGAWKLQRGSADTLVSSILTRAVPGSVCSSTLLSPVFLHTVEFIFSSFLLLFSWHLKRVAVNPGLNIAALLCHCMDTDQAGPEMWGRCRHLGFCTVLHDELQKQLKEMTTVLWTLR